MAILEKKVALFMNTENLVYKELYLERCKQLESYMDIFVCDNSSDSFLNLGMNINVSYYNYDYVVMINPFKKSITELNSVLLQRQLYYFENVIGDIEQLNNEIDILEKSKIEGMLVPFVDYIKSHNMGHYDNWADSYHSIKEIIDENDLKVIISEEKSPVISEDGFAIIKTEAIKGIEKIKCDKITSQDFAYLLAIYMQKNGYLPSYMMRKELLVNNQYGYEAFNEFKMQYFPPIMQLESEIYFDFGLGFEVSKVHRIEYILKIGKKEEIGFSIKIPKNVKYIRFDPCEKFMCVCTGIHIDGDTEGKIEINNINGLHFENEDLFLTKDPQYILSGDFSDLDEIEIKIENLSIFWSENGFKKEFDDIFQEREELYKSVNYLTEQYNLKLSDFNSAKEELVQKENYINSLLNDLETLKNQIRHKDCNINELENKYQQTVQEIDMMKQSRSWRYTAWLRKNK